MKSRMVVMRTPVMELQPWGYNTKYFFFTKNISYVRTKTLKVRKKIIFFESSTLFKFLRNHIYLTYSFIGKNLTDIVDLDSKLHNLYSKALLLSYPY